MFFFLGVSINAASPQVINAFKWRDGKIERESDGGDKKRREVETDRETWGMREREDTLIKSQPQSYSTCTRARV